MRRSPKGKIFHDFRKLVPVDEILSIYDITEVQLIEVLQKSIKGNYDYVRILKARFRGQKQFIKHLNNRWDPLNPRKKLKEVSPYVT